MLSPASASTADDGVSPTGSPLIQNTKLKEQDTINKDGNVKNVKQDTSVLTSKNDEAKETALEKNDEENLAGAVKVTTKAQEQVGATAKENERPAMQETLDSRAAKQDNVLLTTNNGEANKSDSAQTKKATSAVSPETAANTDNGSSSAVKTEPDKTEEPLIAQSTENATQPETATTKEETLSSDEGTLVTAEVIANADEASGPALQEAEVLSVSLPDSHTDTDPTDQEATVAGASEDKIQVCLEIVNKGAHLRAHIVSLHVVCSHSPHP